MTVDRFEKKQVRGSSFFWNSNSRHDIQENPELLSYSPGIKAAHEDLFDRNKSAKFFGAKRVISDLRNLGFDDKDMKTTD